MTIEIHHIPVISTGHLTQEVAERLTQERNENPWCVCAEWEHGFFLYLDEPEAGTEECPQCLLDIRNWLRRMETTSVIDNCRWVRLDTDADAADTLPFYDW